MQEEQGATAPCHRARIVRFTVGEQGEAVSLRFAHRRRGIFSALLPQTLSSRGGPVAPSRPHLRGTFQIIRSLTGMPLGIGQDLHQETPGGGIPLSELPYEGGVCRHLVPFEHEIFHIPPDLVVKT